jgi:hypothetical protein
LFVNYFVEWHEACIRLVAFYQPAKEFSMPNNSLPTMMVSVPVDPGGRISSPAFRFVIQITA